MTPLYHRPGPNVAFWTLVAIFAASEWVSRFRSRLNRTGEPVERWSLLVVGVAIGAGVFGGFKAASWRTAEIGGYAPFVLGLAVMALGIAIRQWSILTLGRFFTVEVRVQAGQTVVERGPYRYVRHPSYTGLILFFVGLGLALTNWVSLGVLAVVPTAGLLVRIRSEERALEAGLGDEYRSYAATHRRLVPGVW